MYRRQSCVVSVGFAPKTFQPGAFGEAGYSPLIRLPDGTIGVLTGPEGAPFGASGFVVNCPIVALLPKP